MAYFKLSAKDITEGVTIRLIPQVGNVSLFVSTTFPHPNSAFYDRRIDEEGEIFLQLGNVPVDRNRREISEVEALFIAVEGTGDVNDIEMQILSGNTGTVSIVIITHQIFNDDRVVSVHHIPLLGHILCIYMHGIYYTCNSLTNVIT